MSHRPSRRRSPPLVVWFMLGVAATAVSGCAALGLWSWQQNERASDHVREIQNLQGELAALQREHQTAQAQIVALQSTATAREDRIAALEARVLSFEARDTGQQLAALQLAAEAANTPQQIADLKGSWAELQSRVSGFQTSLDELAGQIEALDTSQMLSTSSAAMSPQSDSGDTEQALPPEVRLSVTRQRQSHNLSCESSAASMAAQYHGVPLAEAEVLAALPRNDNPYLGFRGNVDGPTGSTVDYGVYSGPILDILNSRGLPARSVEGGLSGIKAALARGNPVIAWLTYNCQPGTPTTTLIGDQEVTLVPYQHVVVVTGYNAEGVWANDPWDGQEDFYPSADFVRALGYLGNMVVEVAAP